MRCVSWRFSTYRPDTGLTLLFRLEIATGTAERGMARRRRPRTGTDRKPQLTADRMRLLSTADEAIDVALAKTLRRNAAFDGKQTSAYAFDLVVAVAGSAHRNGETPPWRWRTAAYCRASSQ